VPRFMVSLVVRWVTPALLVSEFLGNGIMPDAIYLQDSILFSFCITPTLTVCFPFGRQVIPEYGLCRAF
jgi:hypothetical protein